jgi:hypothetical protein
MTVIAEKDRGTIRDLLAREFDAPVELMLFTRSRSAPFDPGRPECQTCAETRELLEELTGLAEEKLTLTVHDLAADPSTATAYNVRDVPTVVVRRARIGERMATDVGTDTTERTPAPSSGEPAPMPGADEAPANVRFVGLPGGYEFSTLVADVVDVSKGRTDLSENGRAAVRAIESPVLIQVFVTPT